MNGTRDDQTPLGLDDWMADWMETIAPKGLGWGRFFEIYHTQLNLFPYIPSSHQVWRIMLECKMIRLVHGFPILG